MTEFHGATRDNPPPGGRPGDSWWPEGSPRLRMNDAREWVPDTRSLASLYGVCTTCGAARTQVLLSHDVSPGGALGATFGLVCSADPDHMQSGPV